MSAIEEIYDAIAAWTPTYSSDVTVRVRNYDEVLETLHEKNLPMRMLSTVDPKDSSDFVFVALGKVTGITWNILDRLYMQGVMLDQGLEHANPRVVKYAKSYYEAVRNDRSPTSQSHVRAVSISPPYVAAWPDGEGGLPYYVVDCVVQVEEFISAG